jgi:hypothetical protein
MRLTAGWWCTVSVVLRIVTHPKLALVLAQSLLSPASSSTKYLLVGVSGGLQDGFPERSKMDYIQYDEVTNTTITITPAIYIGKALIRGYKAFLDVMEMGYRQYMVCMNCRWSHICYKLITSHKISHSLIHLFYTPPKNIG